MILSNKIKNIIESNDDNDHGDNNGQLAWARSGSQKMQIIAQFVGTSANACITEKIAVTQIFTFSPQHCSKSWTELRQSSTFNVETNSKK